MKINIIGGRGVMGKVHAPIFERHGHEVVITGRNSNPTMEEAAKNSDISIITVPIDATKETIERVAPHCSAIMDFTGIKQMPLEAMLQHADVDAEVGGLHPLYGDVRSLQGRTVVYCRTERSGDRCTAIIDALKKEGAIIKEMKAQQHDWIVAGILQNARLAFMRAYGSLVAETGMSYEDIYALSPPPTKIILDLIARQSNPTNDALYREMEKNNPFKDAIERKIVRTIGMSLEDQGATERIRAFFGNNIAEAQERANKYINGNN